MDCGLRLLDGSSPSCEQDSLALRNSFYSGVSLPARLYNLFSLFCASMIALTSSRSVSTFHTGRGVS